MADHRVVSTDELEEGDHVVVELEGREIGVFNVNGEYFGYTNWCAHQSGPICEGPKAGLREATFDNESLELEFQYSREDEIIACPWHGWEFDLVTGDCHSKSGIKLISHDVFVEDGDVVVSL